MVQNWPTRLKTLKMGVFRIFSKTAHWNFLFFAGSLVSGVKKYYGFCFWGKFEKWRFLFFLIFNFFFKNRRKKTFRGKKSTFYPSNPPYDLLLPTNFEMLKTEVFHILFKKNITILFYYYFSWNMVSRVEFGVCELLPFSNWAGFCPKMVKIISFLA